jgi:hypothetical protein
LVSKIFRMNPWFDDERGGIPYFVIANKLGVHKNTLRNWTEREMAPGLKAKVLQAIYDIKQELANAQ